MDNKEEKPKTEKKGKYVVKDGDSMHGISQKYRIRLKNLYKMILFFKKQRKRAKKQEKMVYNIAYNK